MLRLIFTSQLRLLAVASATKQKNPSQILPLGLNIAKLVKFSISNTYTQILGKFIKFARKFKGVEFYKRIIINKNYYLANTSLKFAQIFHFYSNLCYNFTILKDGKGVNLADFLRIFRANLQEIQRFGRKFKDLAKNSKKFVKNSADLRKANSS